MPVTPHYIAAANSDGYVGGSGASLIQYFKAGTVAEMNAIPDEQDGDLCYVLANDTLYLSQNGVWSALAAVGGISSSVQSGTRAARPAASQAGKQYFATDQVALYLDTGSAWVRITTPAGVPAYFDGAVAPSGWVLRNGTSYDKTNLLYADLFDAIGYTHGGSGNNFNVADGRGRALVAQEGSGSFSVLGSKTGSQTVVMTIAQMPVHGHLSKARIFAGGANIDAGGVYGYSEALNPIDTTSTAGGDQAHPNIQPSIVALGIIKL
jgi:microcystin-dependent protein